MVGRERKKKKKIFLSFSLSFNCCCRLYILIWLLTSILENILCRLYLLLPLLTEESKYQWLSNQGNANCLCKEAKEEKQTTDIKDPQKRNTFLNTVTERTFQREIQYTG